MDALVINLERDYPLYEGLKVKCKENGHNPVRINAIHGEHITDQTNMSWYCSKFCTPVQYGTWMSHQKAWEYVITNNLDYALILEDDAVFVPDYTSKLAEIGPQVPTDFDIIYMGTLLENYPGTPIPFIRKLALVSTKSDSKPRIISKNVYVPDVNMGTHAYVVSKHGAQELLSLLKIASGYIDIGMSRHFGKLKVYNVYPNLINQTSVYKSKTFPTPVNNLLNKVHMQNIGMGWAVSIPWMSVQGYYINAWTFFFLIMGILSRFFKTVLYGVILFISIMLVFEKQNVNTYAQVIGVLIVFAIGHTMARLAFK